MTRKIIQIAVDSQPDAPAWNAWVCVYALCDDGTMWEIINPNDEMREPHWRQLPNIPQDREETTI